MSERPKFRDPFNPLHFTADLFSSRQRVRRVPTKFPQEVLEDQDKRFVLPGRELKQLAIHESKAYQATLETLGGRIPRMGEELHEVSSGLRLDNVNIVADTLQTSAQLAAFLYDKALMTRGVTTKASDKDKIIKKIENGTNSLEEAVWFLGQTRSVLPKILDSNIKPGNHPSLRLKPEGLIALAVLSATSPEAQGAAEITEAALRILEAKNPYALRLYYENPELFSNPTGMEESVEEEEVGISYRDPHIEKQYSNGPLPEEKDKTELAADVLLILGKN